MLRGRHLRPVFFSPAAIFCVLIYTFEQFVLDFHLIYCNRRFQAAWIVGDILGGVLLCASMDFSLVWLARRRRGETVATYNVFWVVWLAVSGLTSAKVIVMFLDVDEHLACSKQLYLGGGVVETTALLGSCIFLLYLSTLHDAPLLSHRQAFIKEMTRRIVMDYMDAVELLVTFHRPAKEEAHLDRVMQVAVLAVVTLNFVTPCLQLIVLHLADYGHVRMRVWKIYLYRMWLIFATNVPNLMVRLVLLFGFETVVSLFLLKNVLFIVLGFHEFHLLRNEELVISRRSSQVDSVNMDDQVGNTQQKFVDLVSLFFRKPSVFIMMQNKMAQLDGEFAEGIDRPVMEVGSFM